MKNLRFSLIIFAIGLGNCSIFANSPYEISWGRDGTIMGVSVLNAIVSSSFDSNLKPITVEDIQKLSRDEINSFDRSAAYNYDKDIGKLSDYSVGICMISPIILTLSSNDIRSDFLDIGLMYFETLMFATFTPSYTKSLVERFRPYVYNPEMPLQEKLDLNTDTKKSFFSGHTCVAFASSIFFAKVYDDYYPDSQYTPYIYAGAILGGSLVGFFRYESGWHFPTDVIVGAVVGSIFGYSIPLLHQSKNSAYTLTPGSRVSNIGISFSYKF